jgi:Outer membrane lipoprotein-sorting protein
MKMSLNDTHAKTQRRKETQMSKAQPFFAPLRLCVSICLLSFAVGATAETTNDLSDAEIQGRQLAQKILEQTPAANLKQTGVLKIREAKGESLEDSIDFQISLSETNWTSNYQATDISSNEVILDVVHHVDAPNDYFLTQDKIGESWRTKSQALSGNKTMIPYATSDFWIADLGLEFFHWPQQKVLKKDVHRSRGCIVLESTNPNPSTNGYSRVVSWIDEESLGIVEAYAYDANGKLLKDFYPKDFKKVNGQWQVQTLVMENVQTGSRSRLEFDLNKP